MAENMSIFSIADIHRTTLSPDPNHPFGDTPGWRSPKYAQQSILAAVAQSNTLSPDLTVWNGDLVNGGDSGEGNQRDLNYTAFVDDLAGLNDLFYYTFGHWDFGQSDFSQADYDEALDSDTGIGSLIPTGADAPLTPWWPDAATDNSPIAYTLIVKGFKLIFLAGILGTDGMRMTGETTGPVAKTQQEWFDDRLAEAEAANQPVIVFTHMPFVMLRSPPGRIVGYADAIASLEAQSIKAVVVQSHVHIEDQVEVVNDITYISQRGDVWSEDEDDPDRFSHMLIDIIPNALLTPNGLKPNVKVTGYGFNGTTNFKQYLVA